MRAAASSTATVLWALVILPPARGQPAAADDPAVTAARKRQEAVRTASVKLEVRHTIPRGSVSASYTLRPKSAPPVPEEDKTLGWADRLVLDGEKVRYEKYFRTITMPSGRIRNRYSVSVFDGSVSIDFYSHGIGESSVPRAIIRRNTRLDEVTDLLVPVTMVFRGLNRNLNFYPLTEMKPSGVVLPINGTPCREHILNNGPPEVTTSFFLDPGAGWVPLRITRQRLGRLSSQCDIEYHRHESGIWFPFSWVYTQYGAEGTAPTTTKVEVLDIRLNEPQAPEQFELVFPEGTQVYDERTGKEYRVQPDGTMRVLSPSGEELPDFVTQPVEPWYQRNQGLLVCFGVILGCLVLRFALRKR